MNIKMVRPRIMKKYGNKGNQQFYRFELVGDKSLLENVNFTWAESIDDLKIKVKKRIEQFKQRQLEVLHAKFKNGIRP